MKINELTNRKSGMITYAVNFSEEVARGAELLDEKIPGWHEVIALDKLDMRRGEHCILGQLFVEDFVNGLVDRYGENYEAAVDFLDLNSAMEPVFGFNLRIHNMEESLSAREYEKLLLMEQALYDGKVPSSIIDNPGGSARLCAALWSALAEEWIALIVYRRGDAEPIRRPLLDGEGMAVPSS